MWNLGPRCCGSLSPGQSLFLLRFWLRFWAGRLRRPFARSQFAARAYATAARMHTAVTARRSAFLLTSSQCLLLRRTDQAFNLLMGLLAQPANLFVLLLNTKRRVAANRLHLAARTLFDLPALLHRRLGDTGLLPAGLLLHTARSGSSWRRRDRPPGWWCGACGLRQ